MPDRYRENPDLPRRPGREGAHGDREERSFGEEGRFSSDQARYFGADRRDYGPYRNHDPAAGDRDAWRRGRYGSRQDADRDLYASGHDARADYGPDDAHGYRSFEGDYHREQEYGVPAGGRVSRREAPAYGSRQRRGPYADGPYGDQPLPHDAGSREFGLPADYAYHPNLDRDLEPEYLAWRDEQLRNHDRDYADWRAEQHKAYDDDYRAFRTERKSSFGKSFKEWQAERRASGEITPPPGAETPDDKV